AWASREILFHRDSRPPRARRPPRAARRLRVARASRPVQGLGARLLVELRESAAAARGVLDPLRRRPAHPADHRVRRAAVRDLPLCRAPPVDRKSTRLNSSHQIISYALLPPLFPYTTLFRSCSSTSRGASFAPGTRARRSASCGTS